MLVVAALAGAGYGVRYYIWSLSHESTDDAQVEGDIHAIGPRVAGYVAEVVVDDNQKVAAGQVLVKLDPRDFEARVRLAEGQLGQARGTLAAAQANLANLRETTAAKLAQAEAALTQAQSQVEAARQNADAAKAQYDAAQASRAQADAQVAAAQADLDAAEFNLQRLEELRRRNEVAEMEYTQANSTARVCRAKLDVAQQGVTVAQAALIAARNGYDAAQAAIAVAEAAVLEQRGKVQEQQAGPNQVRQAEGQVELARAQVHSAEAQLELARLDLTYATISAPADGLVSRRSVRIGQYVQPGQPFLAIVPLANAWVVANFKETQLRGMQVGQPAELTVDAYPGHKFRGRVDSLSAGTGARFSLLPPENATGNYVKIVQRVPVKIVLDAGERDPQRPLRLGMNVIATVDIGAAPTSPANTP